ncbi:MAG: hypothetical protein HYV28_16610, partial [Ignavibacteriales bacterium]|nr:hypothetical protein [Ignavibacteriales bacterium]
MMLKMHKIFRFTAALSLVFLFITQGILAQQKGIIKAVVKDKQTIRDISREYLQDADLWEEILK